ncbi:MAG TPA: hypothetical protein VGN82_00460 [Bosea sp. (in: a-proteobacteria)]|uniref:hypothetical protein n=1 Tax=Bosea sp. (in: a-proteobacteria) TaxID=1871050 RepID=UPI002E0F1B8A|nr:hypothetical protein [Bosea sp. (in: a-proteobacteria)]
MPQPPDFATLEAAAQAGNDERQKFMALVGDLNFSWSNNESLFIYVLMLLAGTDEVKAAIIHATLNTTRARLDLVQRLSKVVLADGIVRRELDDIVNTFSNSTRLRNELTHATFVPGSHGEVSHTQSMKLQEGGRKLRFGAVRSLDEQRLHEIHEAVQDLKTLNRRIWAFLPLLEQAIADRAAPALSA